MYKIDKNIPIPNYESKNGRGPAYPFEDMVIGDSLFEPMDGLPTTIRSKVYSAATSYGKANGMKFKGRRVEGGVRVWRVE